MLNEDYISVKEAAELMGISRVAVFNKIKKGEIEAQKIGRAYIVNKKSLGSIYQALSPSQQKTVARAVAKAAKDYSETLKRLGKE